MKHFLLLILLLNGISPSICETKMKIKILPPNEDSQEHTKSILYNFKKLINDEIRIQDSEQLRKVYPETMKTSFDYNRAVRVKIPIYCDSIGGCNKEMILEELSEILDVPKYRLNVLISKQ